MDKECPFKVNKKYIDEYNRLIKENNAVETRIFFGECEWLIVLENVF